MDKNIFYNVKDYLKKKKVYIYLILVLEFLILKKY